MSKASKRILSVKVKRMADSDGDTSCLGNYSDKRLSEYSIDRMHSEDCNSVLPATKENGDKLDRIAAYVETLSNAETDATEREALLEACDELQQIADDWDDCDCRGNLIDPYREMRYFNPSFNYVNRYGAPTDGLTPEEVRKYTLQDYQRMEALNNGGWCFVGVRTDAQVQLLPDGPIQDITSGGLWGIESDSDKSYFEEVTREQLFELRAQLKALGFSTRAISQAFKSLTEVDE